MLTAIPMTFNTHNVWLFSGNPECRSDAGNKLLDIPFTNGTLPAFTVFWQYDVKSNSFWLSLRGNDNSPDLTDICKQYGGEDIKKQQDALLHPLQTLLHNLHKQHLFIMLICKYA